MSHLSPWEWIVILIGITLSPWAFWNVVKQVKHKLPKKKKKTGL